MEKKYKCNQCGKEIISKNDAKLNNGFMMTEAIFVFCNDCYSQIKHNNGDEFVRNHYKFLQLRTLIELSFLRVFVVVAFLLSLFFIKKLIYFAIFIVIGILGLFVIRWYVNFKKRQSNIIRDFIIN
jgi:hypothetical protein